MAQTLSDLYNDIGLIPSIKIEGGNIVHVVYDKSGTPESHPMSLDQLKDEFMFLYWQESRNTAAPNVTIPAHQWSATGTEDDIDAVVSPKGLGAFTLQVPDNLDSGGNKRGFQAIDLQMLRDSATHVASGDWAFVVGIACRAAGDSSVAMGNTCDVSGDDSFGVGVSHLVEAEAAAAIGSNIFIELGADYSAGIGSGHTIQADADYAGAMGRDCTISERYGMGLGFNHNVSGLGATAIGVEGDASGDYSMTGGFKAKDNGILGRFVRASGGFGAVVGTAQYSDMLKGQSTTDATSTRLQADIGTFGTIAVDNQLTLQDDEAMYVKGRIIGKQSGSTNMGIWEFECGIARNTGAATTAIIHNNVTQISNINSWGTPTLTADTTLGCLQINVVGLAATNINWNCKLETVDVVNA